MPSDPDRDVVVTASMAEAQRGRVLLVTRSRRQRGWGRRWLEQSGFDVDTATCIDSALDKLADNDPAAVIVDAAIRDVTGRRLFEIVLDKRSDDVRVFVLCKSAREYKLVQQNDRAEILRKPFDWQLIARRVHRAVRSSCVELELAHARKALEVAKISAAEAARHVMEMRGIDRLTGLPARERFVSQVARAAGEADELHAPAVLVVGIDRFDLINDAVGHAAANEVLHQFGERLQSLLEEQRVLSETETATLTASVSRVSGARFGLLMSRADAEGIRRLADRATERFVEPFAVDGQSVYLSVTIGAAGTRCDAPSSANLLGLAEQALDEARTEELDFKIFDATSSQVHTRSLMIEDCLQRALQRGQLHLDYQPIMDWHGRDVLAAEALLRWTHPDAGEVPPEEFLPVAERGGLIAEINAFVIDAAVRQLEAWAKDEQAPNRIAVNMSYRQLTSGKIVDVVKAALSRYGIAGDRLQIEVSEADLLNKGRDVFAVMHQLKGLGVRLAIDQFGNGSFSLALLEQLPLDAVKIERARVSGSRVDRRADAIGSGIVAIAKRLDLAVTAVGIESEAQVRRLRNWGCDEFQGNYFSSAVPADELTGRVIAGLRDRGGQGAATDAAKDSAVASDLRPESRTAKA